MHSRNAVPQVTSGSSLPSQPTPPPSSLKRLKDGSRRLAKTGEKVLRLARVQLLGGVRALPVTRNALHLPCNDLFEIKSSPRDGVKIHRVSPEQPYTRAVPEMPGETEVHEQFAKESRGVYGASFVAELARGRLWGNYGGVVFTRNGHLVPALSKDIWGPDLHSAFAVARLPRPEWLPGRTLSLVTPEASSNYHHWMIDLLPRVGILQRAGFEARDFDHVLLKYKALPFQRETLRRCGIDEKRIRVVADNAHIEAEHLVVPSLHLADVRVSADDLQFVRRLFVPTEPPPKAARRRLYVGRSDAAYRRVTNQAELSRLLEKYGFEEVAMSRYSVEAGAKLFSEAEIIVGPNGSALANLVFAHSKAKVIEFFAPGWIVCYNWMIGANLGLPFTAIIGRGDRLPRGALPRDLKQDIDLDLALVENVLRTALQTS